MSPQNCGAYIWIFLLLQAVSDSFAIEDRLKSYEMGFNLLSISIFHDLSCYLV